MKSINTYINEKLVIGNNLEGYKYHPKTKDELIEIIQDKIEKEGLGTKSKPLDLNDIDTSEITSMKNVFNKYNALYKLTVNGVFDVSKWDVSNVKDMYRMFFGCKNFNSDLNNWKVSKDTITDFMFSGCLLAPNPPKWYKS